MRYAYILKASRASPLLPSIHASFRQGSIEQDLCRVMAFTPSPLMGEGWGEGEKLAQPFVSSHILTPSPQRLRPPRFALPARGKGAKSGVCVSPVSVSSVAIDVARIYLEGFAGEPAPAVHSRIIRVGSIKTRSCRKAAFSQLWPASIGLIECIEVPL